MNPTWKAVLFVVLGIFIQGCLRTSSTIFVKKDGSAILIDSVLFFKPDSILTTLFLTNNERLSSFQNTIDSISPPGKEIERTSLRGFSTTEGAGYIAEYSIPEINNYYCSFSRAFDLYSLNCNIKCLDSANFRPRIFSSTFLRTKLKFRYTDNALTTYIPVQQPKIDDNNREYTQQVGIVPMSEIQRYRSYTDSNTRISFYIVTELPIISTNATVSSSKTFTLMDLQVQNILDSTITHPAMAKSVVWKGKMTVIEHPLLFYHAPVGTFNMETKPTVQIDF